jgi:hypothetical protein
MWRRLLARAHLDAGGTHELFIWTGAVRDAVCNERLSSRDDKSTMPRFNEDPSRVPFDRVADLEVLTDRALTMAAAVAEPYGYLLRQVTDCYLVSEKSLRVMQVQGASYKTLAAIGHTVSVTNPERVQWYRIAEAAPLSQRRAGHILGKLQKAAA